jgi:hypothetical protein
VRILINCSSPVASSLRGSHDCPKTKNRQRVAVYGFTRKFSSSSIPPPATDARVIEVIPVTGQAGAHGAV